MTTPKRAWIYTRVAAQPTEDLAPLEMQKEGLYALAARHGYTIVGCSGEYAGGLTLEREGIQEMLLAAEKGLFDVLLAKDVARITRNYVDWNHIQTTFEKLGVAVHTTDWGYFEPKVNDHAASFREVLNQHANEDHENLDDPYMGGQEM